MNFFLSLLFFSSLVVLLVPLVLDKSQQPTYTPHMKNLPWKAEKQPTGWVIRDCKGELVFISQRLGNREEEEKEVKDVCATINKATQYYLWDK